LCYREKIGSPFVAPTTLKFMRMNFLSTVGLNEEV
jgi:hypothetical protein